MTERCTFPAKFGTPRALSPLLFYYAYHFSSRKSLEWKKVLNENGEGGRSGLCSLISRALPERSTTADKNS
ncbi:uncharacterized protein V6R79_020337 [Siganus canaliculatus]